MKKENYYKFCWLISILLVIGYAINLIIDWVRYNSTLNSAPFYLWFLVGGVVYLIPALVLFLIGWRLKKKYPQ